MSKRHKENSSQSNQRHHWNVDDIWEKQSLGALLLENLPHPAMIVRKDRAILAANPIARGLGAKVGGYCWHEFGSSEFIAKKDKEYIDEHNKINAGDNRCYFCLVDEGLKGRKPTYHPEVEAWDKIWDVYWVPLNGKVYFNYAVDVTEQKQAEQKSSKVGELKKEQEQLLEKLKQCELLERQTLEATMAEQRQIGQSLHDNLGQELTGIAFTSKILEQKLAEKSLAEAYDAAEISKRIKQILKQVRSISKGVLAIRLEMGGITRVLREFASQIENIFSVNCTFRCEESIAIDDNIAATHIYHITQEAVNNAIKHGQAKNILISLETGSDDNVILQIKDDGVGLAENLDINKGMGLHSMRHRAQIIGGKFDVVSDSTGGTIVQCSFGNDVIKRGG